MAKRFLGDQYPDMKIISALTDQEALRIIEENSIDAIVCDFYLGPSQMTGLELLEWIREKNATVPFIMFTGRSKEERAIRALNLGADYYLKKDSEDIRALFAELARHIQEAVSSKKKTERIRDEFSKFNDMVDERTRELETHIGGMEESQAYLLRKIDGLVQGQREIIQYAETGFEKIENLCHDSLKECLTNIEPDTASESVMARLHDIIKNTNDLMQKRMNQIANDKIALSDLIQKAASKARAREEVEVASNMPVVLGSAESLLEAFIFLFDAAVHHCGVPFISVSHKALEAGLSISFELPSSGETDSFLKVVSDLVPDTNDETAYMLTKAVSIFKAHFWDFRVIRGKPPRLLLLIP